MGYCALRAAPFGYRPELSVRPQKSQWIERIGFLESAGNSQAAGRGCGQNARATWSGHAARNQRECGAIDWLFALPNPDTFEKIVLARCFTQIEVDADSDLDTEKIHASSKANPALEHKVMSVAEKLKAEGRREGLSQGISRQHSQPR